VSAAREWELLQELTQVRHLAQAWHISHVCEDCLESFTSTPCGKNHWTVRNLLYPEVVEHPTDPDLLYPEDTQ
jgi:hypothetical protein